MDRFDPAPPIDAQHFRRVLGHFPTGVAGITSAGPDGRPLGMAVGSFTSVSLDPPLVAFLPDKKSTTFPRIRQAGFFCVNVLAAGQETVCRAFAARSGDKFSGIAWTPAGTGAPRLDDAVAWINCTIDAIHDAGDHEIVVGRVRALDIAESGLPLLFFQGGYGRFAPLSFAAAGEPDLIDQLRLVDIARPQMERVAADTGVECLAAVLVRGDVVIAAKAGQPAGHRPPSRIGQRVPFVPPLGAALAAWSDTAVEPWLSRLGHDLSPSEREHYHSMLDRVRSRGWSVGLGSATHRELEAALAQTSIDAPTPEELRDVQRVMDELGGEYEPAQLSRDQQHRIRNVTVPVFGTNGNVIMVLSVYGLPSESSVTDIEMYTNELTYASRTVTNKITANQRQT
jgi:flavin reductase (DIM6/NTAB) family NADH-FMN oxidoreductase RutF/DNA-binding IclR family transcriptional regulator